MRQRLETILDEFSAPGIVRDVLAGPVVETYCVELGSGVRVNKVAGLEDDIALRLGVDSVRVVPNLPGMPYLGVEVPLAQRQMVPWVPLGQWPDLPLSLGVDTTGERVVVDLAKAPHLLVAGSTGSGKSVMLHTLICSLLAIGGVSFLLIDPKQLEFRAYETSSRLSCPIVTDSAEAVRRLNQLLAVMEHRYSVLAQAGCRDIGEFNARGGLLSPIVVVIDEWADLYVTQKKGIERPVVRLAQKARAAGIHLVLATQRPSVKVLPGIIKANFPARIALRVTNKTDSRVVLDQNGAEKLLGKGDMLVSGFGEHKIRRVHGAYVDPYTFLEPKGTDGRLS